MRKSVTPATPIRFQGAVRGLSSEGWGVVEGPEGRVFFVRGTWPGDEGTFEVERFEKRFGYAQLVALEKPSPDRAEVFCSVQGYGAGRCGGCSWMIGSYASQLQHKNHRLRYALSRAKLLDDPNILQDTWGSDQQRGYRNRAQFKTDGVQLGFVSEKSHEIIPVESCPVLNDKMATLYTQLQKLPRTDWKPQPPHHWNFIDLDDEASHPNVPLNQRRPFRQGNTAQNEKMKQWLKEKAMSLPRSATVLELFAGSGNFTRIFSELQFTKTLAVEVSQSALANLQLPGVRPVVMDLAKPGAYAELATRFPDTEILFLDPPREGAKGIANLVSQLKKLRTIFYISCDVATFTRDAGDLQKAGFRLAEVQPLDLFPQTPHVETMAQFIFPES